MVDTDRRRMIKINPDTYELLKKFLIKLISKETNPNLSYDYAIKLLLKDSLGLPN